MAARIHCDFFSEVLGVSTSMTVLLPEPHRSPGPSTAPTDGYPLLLLLHGLSDDHTTWVRQTAIERYLAGTNLAVVMPDGGRSFYTDMAEGPPYFTFLSDELPAVARFFFPITRDPRRCFAAGLSMGGYGAVKLALRFPERFAAAASLSGALDVGSRGNLDPQRRGEHERIFGRPSGAAPDDDLFALAEKAAASGVARPRLFVCCGTDDFLIEESRRFRQVAGRHGFDLRYEEHAGEGHTWSYWDRMLRPVIAWLG